MHSELTVQSRESQHSIMDLPSLFFHSCSFLKWTNTWNIFIFLFSQFFFKSPQNVLRLAKPEPLSSQLVGLKSHIGRVGSVLPVGPVFLVGIVSLVGLFKVTNSFWQAGKTKHNECVGLTSTIGAVGYVGLVCKSCSSFRSLDHLGLVGLVGHVSLLGPL